jgi:hypothetical protein
MAAGVVILIISAILSPIVLMAGVVILIIRGILSLIVLMTHERGLQWLLHDGTFTDGAGSVRRRTQEGGSRNPLTTKRTGPWRRHLHGCAKAVVAIRQCRCHA